MAKKLITANTKSRKIGATVSPTLLKPATPKKTVGRYDGYPINGGRKYTKGFTFFNPIMIVMLVTSCIIGCLCFLGGTDTAIKAGFSLGAIAMFVQFYILFPAWVAFGRDCKYKEFILFTSIVFLGPFALIWALVGEKKEYDHPVL
jgi:hypothetical protein